MLLQINSAPIKYSSDSPQEDPSQHDNEIVDITFRSAYKWQTGVYKEVCIFLITKYDFEFIIEYKMLQ